MNDLGIPLFDGVQDGYICKLFIFVSHCNFIGVFLSHPIKNNKKYGFQLMIRKNEQEEYKEKEMEKVKNRIKLMH